MNNFFIDIIARSFTNIEEVLRNKFDNSDARRTQETLKQFDSVKKYWVGEVCAMIKENFRMFERDVNSRETEKVKKLKQSEDDEKVNEKRKAAMKQQRHSVMITTEITPRKFYDDLNL